jgi:Mrp family chromosome partitioning ATPase
MPDQSTSAEGAHVPFLRATRAHPLVVGAILVIAIAATVVLVKTRSPTYKATAQVLVTPVDATNSAFTGLPVVNDSSSDPTMTIQTAASLIQTRAAAAAAARTMGKSWTIQRVLDAVSVQQQGETDVISVTASAQHSGTAARLANAYVNGALSTRAAALASEARVLIGQLQAQEHSLPAGSASQVAALATEIATLQTVASGQDPNFSSFEPAATPTSPSATSAKLLVILAALAGLVIGVGAAMLLEHLNRRVRDEDEILSICPLPVLARVPEVSPAALRVSSGTMPPRMREAYRTLQVQLPRHLDGSARTVMFVSASSGDGKTTATMNLAMLLAAADLDVVIIDFDLRKAEIGRHFGVYTDFMDYFRSNAQLNKILRSVPKIPRLHVVSTDPHGDVTPLLEAVSHRMPEILRDVGQLADYVVIDTAPLGHVSDALRVAPLVDDVILVARIGRTDRTELRRSRELLERMGRAATGLVIVGDVGARGDGYGYGYGDAEPYEADRPDSLQMATSDPSPAPANSRSVERDHR